MYAEGLLATADVYGLAEAHVSVYDAMRSAAGSDRYICFDHVVGSDHQAAELCRQVRFAGDFSGAGGYGQRFHLSNEKLRRLQSS